MNREKQWRQEPRSIRRRPDILSPYGYRRKDRQACCMAWRAEAREFSRVRGLSLDRTGFSFSGWVARSSDTTECRSCVRDVFCSRDRVERGRFRTLSPTDPSERVQRTRFLTCQFRSCGVYRPHDSGFRQWIFLSVSFILSQFTRPFRLRRDSHFLHILVTWSWNWASLLPFPGPRNSCSARGLLAQGVWPARHP